MDDVHHRLFAQARVVLCHPTDGASHDQTHQNGVEHVHAAEGAGAFSKEVHAQLRRQHDVDQEIACDGGQNDGPPIAPIQGRLHLCLFRIVPYTDDLRSKDGEHNAERGNDQWKQDGGHATEVVGNAAAHVVDHVVAKHHGGKHGGHVRAEEVGTHARDISYVVSYVVCNGGRVSGVILGDACFHLAHEVCAYVGSLGVNPATDACEEGNALCAQREACKGLQDDCHLTHGSACTSSVTAHPTQKKDEENAQSEDCETGHTEAHHHASCKGDFQTLAQARACGLRGAYVGLGRNAHANVSCQSRKNSADDKGHDDEPVRGFHHGGNKAQEGACHDDEDGQDAVFRAQKRQSSFVDVLCDFTHSGRARVLFAHPSRLDGHDDQAENGQCWYEVKQ